MRERIEVYIRTFLYNKFRPIVESGTEGKDFLLYYEHGDGGKMGCGRFLPFGNCDHSKPWPWWKLFHAVVNVWFKPDTGKRHTHGGWSVSIVLCGSATEDTLQRQRRLRMGSIVVRGPNIPHRFIVDEGTECWTLFIHGRKKGMQILV